MNERRKTPNPNRVVRRFLSRKKIIAIFNAPGKRVDIAAEYNICPATVTHIKLGDRHYKITQPIRLAAALNAELVTMACGVELW